MLTKAEKTRQMIIEKAAPIFNKKGFSGTSMSDILSATGLAKGGLYGNFKSKEEIAREVFRYSFKKVYDDIVQEVLKEKSPLKRLLAICDYHRNYTKNSPLEGGCPVLNYGTEVDDTMPNLRRDVRAAMEKMLNDIYRIIEKGKDVGEVKKTIDAEKYASFIYSQIEGAILLSKTLGDLNRMHQCMDMLKAMVVRDLKK